MCPLNGSLNLSEPDRLRLYVGHSLYRWYNMDDGQRRRYNGKVVSSRNNNLVVSYDGFPGEWVVCVTLTLILDRITLTLTLTPNIHIDEENDELPEATLLEIFKQMKKDLRKGKKKSRPSRK